MQIAVHLISFALKSIYTKNPFVQDCLVYLLMRKRFYRPFPLKNILTFTMPMVGGVRIGDVLFGGFPRDTKFNVRARTVKKIVLIIHFDATVVDKENNNFDCNLIHLFY